MSWTSDLRIDDVSDWPRRVQAYLRQVGYPSELMERLGVEPCPHEETTQVRSWGSDTPVAVWCHACGANLA